MEDFLMTQRYKDLTQEVMGNLAYLRKGMPQVMKCFGELGNAAIADGALDPKTKELIALAVGVAARCDGCIGFHSKALVDLGATAAEIQEALGVAIYMGGGPSVMYAANAVAAFSEFSAAASASAATSTP
jgi:AhpD family alkylhydroperoxidase